MPDTALDPVSAAPAAHADSFRSAMRRHPGGVTVVTFDTPDGPAGFTATSFASVSMTPMLVTFNALTRSTVGTGLGAADTVLIHLLGAEQRDLAARFAGPAASRFADKTVWTRLVTGEPLLGGTATWMRARVDRRIVLGDHLLVVGLVTEVHADPSGPAAPLVYHDGRYRGLRPL